MDKLQLLYGDNLILMDKIEIKHPKLIEIKEYGYEKYMSMVQYLTMTPQDVADILWFEMKIWYEDITQWELFISIFKENPLVYEAFEFFTGQKFELCATDRFYLYCKDLDINMNENLFMQMSSFIRSINFISSKTELDLCGNKRTKKYLLQQQYKKRTRKYKSNIDLTSMVSAMLWKSGIGEEIWNYPIYRVYEGYYRLHSIENYNHTMFGLYSGNIDTKKTKIDLEKINWSNIIDVN